MLVAALKVAHALPPNMLSGEFRFHSRGGVRHVYQTGKTIRTKELSLVFAPNERGFQRHAVVVSRRISKLAVIRNRIRRRVYEAIRLELAANPDFRALKQDFVFVVYSKSLETLDFTKLRSLISYLIQQSML